MEDQQVEITKIEAHTHNVLNIYTEKPKGYNFKAGQATQIYIDQFGWRKEGRFFAFACAPEDDYLEFLVKTNIKLDHVLDKILSLKKGDQLLLTEAVGELNYKGEGTFIAGGVGITPFISILKELNAKDKLGDNKLIYANRSEDDIIYQKGLQKILGNNFINILEEATDEYAQGLITEGFLKAHAKSLQKNFYLCGPPMMVRAVEKHLINLNVSRELIFK